VDFQALLPKRRMVRHYAPEPVSRDAIERIVATVRRAPSAGYSQGQRLLVVTEDEGRATISRIMADTGWTTPEDREPWLESAPVHVLVCIRENDYHERYTQADKLAQTGGVEIDWPVPFWFVDAGAALMMLLLAAIDEGLAAGLTGVEGAAANRIRSAFGVPDDITIVALVTVGVPAPDPGWSAVTSRATKPRRGPSDSVRWEHWDR
jgi:FMN reductase [NAD(P)H]